MAFALAVLLASAAWCAETVVVLGSEGKAYLEALEGFREAYGPDFERRQPRQPLPDDTRVVVAFGGRAAAERYPSDVTLIFGMAPLVFRVDHAGRVARVATHPAPAELLAEFARRGHKRVGVLWWTPAFRPLIDRLETAARDAQVELVIVQVRAGRLADALRSLHNRVDAIWVPADPALAGAGVVETIRTSAGYWNVPLYSAVPLPNGRPSDVVGATFRGIGRAAAEAARDAAEGRLRSRYRPALETVR